MAIYFAKTALSPLISRVEGGFSHKVLFFTFPVYRLSMVVLGNRLPLSSAVSPFFTPCSPPFPQARNPMHHYSTQAGQKDARKHQPPHRRNPSQVGQQNSPQNQCFPARISQPVQAIRNEGSGMDRQGGESDADRNHQAHHENQDDRNPHDGYAKQKRHCRGNQHRQKTHP
jgi:hypothetical protein